MAVILEISGYKAVGKSTLIEGLRKRFPDAIFREGFRKMKMGYNLEIENEYYENEKIYIKREIEEFREFEKTNKLVVILRGPEECCFFAEKSPELKFKKNWEVEKNLGNDLKQLKQLHADGILWLEADEKILQFRKENDSTKPRNNMEKWNKTWRPYLKDYIMSFPYAEELRTDNMSALQVLDWTVNWIYKKIVEKNELQIPERLYIETTNFCNASCRMCPHTKLERPGKIMDDSIFDRILSQLKDIDLKNTTIFFHKEGEPLLDSKIFDRIMAVKNNTDCKEIAINTNASLLDMTKARLLLDSGVDTIYISFDGFTKASYEYLRIGLNYNVVLNNILNLFALKKSSSSKVKIILQMIKYSGNENEVEDFKNFWKKYDCELFIKEMHSYLDVGMSSITTKLSSEQTKACTDPFNMLVIFADGSYGCCCWDYNNELKIGSINETSIIKGFNGTKIRALQKAHSMYDCKQIVPCNRCMRVFGNDLICGLNNEEEIKIK